jgi:acetylornithine/succinyldiaminopimelate/putrescine aminotransferase/predicted amino acid dehydrogenase
MSAVELLSDLRARGVKLWVDGADLRYRAPKGILDVNAAELLARHKLELIELLKAPSGCEASPQPRSDKKRGSLLDDEVISLSSIPEWRPQEQNAYIHYVAPFRGFLAQCLGVDKLFVRGKGCYLFGADGTPYADFIAQLGALPFGHDPEPIWRALQASRESSEPNLVIGSILHAAGELAEQLLAVAPPGLGHVVFANSGAEAVEAAIKLARCRTGRIGILAAHNGFHGLTLAGMSATDNLFFQRSFGAPVAGFNYVPFGDIAALEAALTLRPDFFAAFIVEIIQGESGIHIAPPGYLAAVRDLCHRFGALLIVDEVQTGLGRTGKLFACEAEGVTPDILALAKALGGGLMPIGACLYTSGVYSEHFELRHGSTLAGNTLACRAGLATLRELTRDDRRLVRQVAAVGDRLMEQLRKLQVEYPMLIREVRGRGLMIGLELALDHVVETQDRMIALLQRQGLLLYMAASYLLNVEHVRIAVSLTKGSVLRIEPPLIADNAFCDKLIGALKRLLRILESGDAGELLAHFVGGKDSRAPAHERTPERSQPSQAATIWRDDHQSNHRKFAFVIHLVEMEDLRRFDPSLAGFSDSDLQTLKSRLAQFIKPFPLGNIAVRSADGRLAKGELIMLPKLPSELLALSGSDAVDLVQAAVDVALERGAEVVGLGGFSSIISDGGLAVQLPAGIRVTSGNSLTAWAAMSAIERACAGYGLNLSDCMVAIVGATGSIGRALALLCTESAGELFLIGNPSAAMSSLARLREVAHDCERHINSPAVAGRTFPPGTVAARLAERGIAPQQNVETCLALTTNFEEHLSKAHIVFIATSAVLPIISAHHLRKGALVCDVSRPSNLAPGLTDARPDVRFVNSGQVRAPAASVLGLVEERNQPNVMGACAAETIVLALSDYAPKQLCGRLDVETIRELGRLTEKSGFSIVGAPIDGK